MPTSSMSPHLQARKVLADCQYAFDLLEACEDNADLQRIYQAVILCLLDTVRDVLYKVDSKRADVSSKLKNAINDAYKAYENEPIYKHFIREQKNNIVHEYKFVAPATEDVAIAAIRDGLVEMDPLTLIDEIPIDQGHYRGQDIRDVMFEALDFWRKTLEQIEQKAFN